MDESTNRSSGFENMLDQEIINSKRVRQCNNNEPSVKGLQISLQRFLFVSSSFNNVALTQIDS